MKYICYVYCDHYRDDPNFEGIESGLSEYFYCLSLGKRILKIDSAKVAESCHSFKRKHKLIWE
jgi:hypothetical protein